MYTKQQKWVPPLNEAGTGPQGNGKQLLALSKYLYDMVIFFPRRVLSLKRQFLKSDPSHFGIVKNMRKL
jgi:hypothetical protein